MQRRLLQATILAVLVAVLVIGVPIAVFSAVQVRVSAEQTLSFRTSAVARDVERRVYINEPVTREQLERWIYEDSSLPVTITVVLPRGNQVSAGPDLGEGPEVARTVDTASGAFVRVAISGHQLAWRVTQVVLFVAAASLLAFVAAVLLARHQARRLAAPLIYLAASAEQLGSGQVRPRVQESGIEEIDLVAAELGRSADRMATRLASERQFSADASHQLRTPLTALSMRLEEIEALSEDPEVRHEAQVALEQVERLVGVVDDLLSNARKASGGQTEVVKLAEVFDQQQTEWAPTYAKAARTLTVESAGDVAVLARPGSLAQVLATLLENSLKYGGGTTRVAVRPATAAHSVVIEVSDEGNGVPADLAPRIFERSVTSGKGTGLGLALARDLVAADGGKLGLSQASPPVFSIFLSAAPSLLDPDRVLPPGSLVAVGRRRRRP